MNSKVSNERYDELTNKINKVKNNYTRVHLQDQLESAWFYDSLDWFNSIARDTNDELKRQIRPPVFPKND